MRAIRSGRRAAWGGAFGVLLLLSICLGAARADDARSLFHDALVSDDSVSYSGTITTVIYDHDSAEATVARIDHKAPHSWRIWYIAPSDAYGRMVVSNESLTYQYEPEQNRVYKNDWSESAPGVAQALDVDRVEQNYSVELGAATTVAGRNARTVSLISKHTGSLVERLWVDSATKLILRREDYHADGSIATKSSFDNIRIGGSLPADLFKLAVPSGMTLLPGAEYGRSTSDVVGLQGATKFHFAAPAALPYGFKLENGSTSSHDGVDTVQLVYGDGLRSFSLFEYTNASMPRFSRVSPKPLAIGSLTGEYADVAGETLASWNTSGLVFTIVGDLAPREISKIGAAIK